MGGNDWYESLKILADVLDRSHKYKLHLKFFETWSGLSRLENKR